MSDDKPFLCSAAGCGQRFTNEDHLAVHKHKHEMTLKFGPARDNSVIVADQTPTPTRFLKNCEEVGLFNELTSPLEHDFKRAAVYDIKKMPLDLSPFATPMIIRNKTEDHSVVAAHRDSPRPHPESTTSDDKEVSLQPTSLPTSTIVHPASLQVPNVLLATSDASVVIQQALPSPTSSSVITQAPSTNRPIVPVSGTFPVILQLPNGQTMPIAIPATIASSLHRPTAIPLVRPITIVPNVPGIPGPPSPQAVQSEAKLKLRAVVSQQLSQVTNEDAGVVQSSAVTHIAALAPALTPSPGPATSPAPPPVPPEEPSPQPLQQPATSTTETPTPPAQHNPITGGRRRRATSEDPDEKRRKFLERNRAAASRCRQKRKVWLSSLEKKAEDLNSMNGQLQNEVTLLRNEVAQLKHLLLAHKDCPVTAMQKKSAYHTYEKEDSCEEMSVPDSLQSEVIQHSSVSTSNGVSSSSTTPAASALASAHVPTTADQSTEEGQPQGGGSLFTAQTQPSGS